jgi:hypothetical protein
VLADQVGLGKTIQLAMAALLMALEDPDGGPILVLAPKPLLQQWQDELMELLLLPSARWNGRAWVDENDLEYPSDGVKSLGKCPRRIGLVSQGLVVRGLPDACNSSCSRRYTCVIVDEAHRARRRKVPRVDASSDEVDERAEPNKLMGFSRRSGRAPRACCWPQPRRFSCTRSKRGTCWTSFHRATTACWAAGRAPARGFAPVIA